MRRLSVDPTIGYLRKANICQQIDRLKNMQIHQERIAQILHRPKSNLSTKSQPLTPIKQTFRQKCKSHSLNSLVSKFEVKLQNA